MTKKINFRQYFHIISEYAGKSDTMTFNYPYKHLPGFKRKYDPPWITIYYDIK